MSHLRMAAYLESGCQVMFWYVVTNFSNETCKFIVLAGPHHQGHPHKYEPDTRLTAQLICNSSFDIAAGTLTSCCTNSTSLHA